MVKLLQEKRDLEKRENSLVKLKSASTTLRKERRSVTPEETEVCEPPTCTLRQTKKNGHPTKKKLLQGENGTDFVTPVS